MSAQGVANRDAETPPISEVRNEYGQSVPDGETRNLFQFQIGVPYSLLLHVLVAYGDNTSQSILALVSVDGSPSVDTPAIIADTGTKAGGSTLAAVIDTGTLKIQLTNSSGQQGNVSASMKTLFGLVFD